MGSFCFQEVETELAHSTRVLEAQEERLLAPKAAAKLAEENSLKRSRKLLAAVEIAAEQVLGIKS